MAKPVSARRSKTLATATVDTLDSMVSLNAALEKARAKYRGDILLKRPKDSVTVPEFLADYNSRTAKENGTTISLRAAESLFMRWVASGDYQRAPMMIPGVDGIPRRTYVYWETKR